MIILNAIRFTLLLSILFISPAWAVVEGYKYTFDNIEDTQRFNHLSENLRCPKCQNQNLADSNSPIASDLRSKVYELMQDGKSDDEIVDHLVARYGDFVRYTPEFRADTLLLWGGPAILFVLGLILIFNLRRRQATSAGLSEQEEARLKRLLTSTHPTSAKKDGSQ
ncbi:MAG: cytochrome c-type biogenesis protein CcmH [Oleibacter sp.]|nr:cytochrome c-type biogenesis protein CcmH [Thalassolituus sp.]